MSINGNKRKTKQLGMPHGTASNKLRKVLLFSLVQQVGLDNCYRCREKIENIDTLSIEHKVPWLDSEDPVGTFFDLGNIAFSHLSCNAGNARQPLKGLVISPHGSGRRYSFHGCRCDLCRAKKADRDKKYKYAK